MGLFDGIDQAEVFERGRYLPPEFRGVLEVKRTISKETKRSGIGFIVEFEVVSVERSGKPDHELSPVIVGQKRTWFQKMSDKTVAFPAVLAWAAGVAGYEAHDKAKIEEEVASGLGDILNHATDNPADNDFVGALVAVETSQITTRNDREFTRHDWIPHEDPEEPEPRDAVDDISG